jgi:hypothetical protein
VQQDFIDATLEDSKPIETYHGVIFSRGLTLRTLFGREITVEDPENLSEGLKQGKRHRFVIAVVGIEKVRAFTQSVTATGKISGTIRNLKWQPDPKQYTVFDEEVVKQPMSIIGTVNGHVLLPRLLLGGAVVGNVVTWGIERYQLVAAYKEGET